MAVSQREAEGFALAAAVAGDRGAARARAGLADSVRDDLTRLATEVQALPSAQRQQMLAALTRMAQPLQLHPPEDANPRALALLAAHTQPELGRAWLQRGGLPRPGFEAEPALLRLLHALAADPECTWRA